MARDVRRLPAEVLGTDVLPTADAFRFLEKRAVGILRPRSVSLFDRPLWLWGERDAVYRRPHGVVGIIGTWNYPIYLNAVQIVQALTAGNGVVWKPSELTPETARVLHSILMRAGYMEVQRRGVRSAKSTGHAPRRPIGIDVSSTVALRH